jgi:hypothetical protein
MSLNYDFDIFDLIPQQAGIDAEASGFLARLGLAQARTRATTGPNRIALFRDQETADALRAAPASLRDYFLAAGFGLNTYTSGVARHRYPAADEAARLEIIERLTELAPSYLLPAPGDYPEGGPVFRLGAFLADLAEATPDVAGATVPETSGDDETRPPHPDLIPLAAPTPSRMPPTFYTTPLPVPATRRKFWQGRFFLAAVGVGITVLVLQISASFGVVNLASL